MKNFQQTQFELTRYLRAPEQNPAPEQVDIRRLHIYRDLIYNNIENFIVNVFPVTRSILSDDAWHTLVRGFIQEHYCQTPYFLQISDEFVQYILQERGLCAGDPPYLLELIHYEWIELALDVSTEVIPTVGTLPKDLANSHPRVSPLVVCLAYQYPVQKISAAHPDWPPEPTQLLVYRNRADKVCFMATNTLTARLIYLLQANDLSLKSHLASIAVELQLEPENRLLAESVGLINELFSLGIISHFE